MASRSPPPCSKRPRLNSQTPKSAPARKTPRSRPIATSTSPSATVVANADTTMDDAVDNVLFESSAPASAPQHHHTHPVQGSRPTHNELYGTAAKAQTPATAFKSGQVSTPSSQPTSHWSKVTSAPEPTTTLLPSGLALGHGYFIFRPVGRCNNSPTGSSNYPSSPARGRTTSADNFLRSSSRCSSYGEISPTHYYTPDRRNYGQVDGSFTSPSPLPHSSTLPAAQMYDGNPFDTPFDTPPRVVDLALPQTQSFQAHRFSVGALSLDSSPGLSPPTFMTYRERTLGASGSSTHSNQGDMLQAPLWKVPTYYPHNRAEDGEIMRPSKRRGGRHSKELLRADAERRRQQEEDADDEEGREGEDSDTDVDFGDNGNMGGR